MEYLETKQKYSRLLALFPVNFAIMLILWANSNAPILKDNVLLFSFIFPIFVPIFMNKIDLTRKKMMLYSLIITISNGFISFLVAWVFLSNPFEFMIVTFSTIFYIPLFHEFFKRFENSK